MNVVVDKRWHLDKKVPVALIITLILQFGAGAWYMSWLTSEVAANSKENTRIDKSVSKFREKNGDIKDRVIRIEEKLISQRDLLERILRKVDGK